MKTLTELQSEIGQWGDETFPVSTSRTVVKHLLEEVLELEEDVFAERNVQEETADCLLLILHMAHKGGFDLAEAVERKMAINRARTWKTTPEPAGHFKHEVGV